MGLFDKIFGTYSDRELKDIKPIVNKILELEAPYKALSDEELKGKTGPVKERYKGGESLDALLPEAFATVREASDRRCWACGPTPCSSSAASCSIRGASPK